jgi:hypothetical protein
VLDRSRGVVATVYGNFRLVGTMAPKLRLVDGTWLADHAHKGRTLLIDLAGDERLSTLAESYAGRLELIRGQADGSGLAACWCVLTASWRGHRRTAPVIWPACKRPLPAGWATTVAPTDLTG